MFHCGDCYFATFCKSTHLAESVVHQAHPLPSSSASSRLATAGRRLAHVHFNLDSLLRHRTSFSRERGLKNGRLSDLSRVPRALGVSVLRSPVPNSVLLLSDQRSPVVPPLRPDGVATFHQCGCVLTMSSIAKVMRARVVGSLLSTLTCFSISPPNRCTSVLASE